jgi:hypothetical protein
MMNRFYTLLVCLLLLHFTAQSQSVSTLRRGFQQPPNAARPVVWWHWIGGNVTREGITKDLEWMHRAGIGGFQAFDVSIGGGQSIDKKVAYGSPEWLDLIRHTATEAERLGLDMTMVTAAGWSETGGTWVKPHEAMKKLVWSQTPVAGGKPFAGMLAQPPSRVGPIQDLPKPGGSATGSNEPTFYNDQRVLAYRTPDAETTGPVPVVTNHKGERLDATSLFDDDLTTTLSLPVPKPDQPVYLQFEYATSVQARTFSITWAGADIFPSKIVRPGYVQVSQDGRTFQTLFALPGPQHDIRALPVRTFAFPEVRSRFFRVVFTAGTGITTVGGPDEVSLFGGPRTPPTTFALAEARFSSAGRVNRWEDKAGFAPMFGFEGLQTPALPQSALIKATDIVDLTDRLKPDGSLNWNVPAGNWTILRIGYSLTGAKNGPAQPAATGLEVDKLSKEHLQSYMRQWANPIAGALGPLYGKRLKYFLVDSYEADAQNWTETMPDEFRTRRGYDLTRYLPVLTGRVVESAEVSDRFLWDYRLTLAEILVENHYQAITEFAHQQGIQTYGEVAGISLPIIQDALRNKAAVDIPMGEFGMTQGLGSGKDWTSPADLEEQKPFGGANDRLNAHQADAREAASAAHVYGKKIVAAESWTGGGYEAPASLKFIGDYWASQGINQFIFHTSAHQPLDTKPGNTMVGTHINRNITWAEQARPFVDYLTRNQYLLQEGRFVADMAYYLGEDIPAAVPYWEKERTPAPEGYDYDYVNTEILNHFTVENGELVLPSGMRYRLLVLPDKQTMTLPTLRKLAELIRNGATVVGPKPERSPSLVGFPAVDAEVLALANEVWGGADGRYTFRQSYGNGQVFWNVPLVGIFGQMTLKPDVAYTRPHTNTRLTWLHRRAETTDYYFILNNRNQVEDMNVTFRMSGKKPERWNADRGTSEPLAYTIHNGQTTVRLYLEPQESVFVVFAESTTQPTLTLPYRTKTVLQTLSGPWSVSFPANMGAPAQVTLPGLMSWTNHPDEGVNYFSGTATYTNQIDVPANQLAAGQTMLLDLGVVRDIAVVRVNDAIADTLWKAPYVTDVTKLLRPGRNKLQIQVTNQWNNRIVGDSKAPEGSRILTRPAMFGGASVLKESGLLGPVVLKVVQ